VFRIFVAVFIVLLRALSRLRAFVMPFVIRSQRDIVAGFAGFAFQFSDGRVYVTLA